MTFTHCDDTKEHFGELKRVLLEDTRFYSVGEGFYPSVTSVISWVNRGKFTEWRERVGQEEANRVTKHATTRGTKLHKLWEVYLQNGDYKSQPEWEVPLVQLMFQASKFYLDTRLDNIYHQETTMASDKLRLAGTVDLICEVDGELAIVDFKTSGREKPEEWLEDYFVQLSAYWAMFSERTGVVPRKLVVFLVAEDGSVQIVERKNIMKYLMTLQQYVNQFIEHKDAGNKRTE
jgi:hypothetical protein